MAKLHYYDSETSTSMWLQWMLPRYNVLNVGLRPGRVYVRDETKSGRWDAGVPLDCDTHDKTLMVIRLSINFLVSIGENPRVRNGIGMDEWLFVYAEV